MILIFFYCICALKKQPQNAIHTKCKKLRQISRLGPHESWRRISNFDLEQAPPSCGTVNRIQITIQDRTGKDALSCEAHKTTWSCVYQARRRGFTA